MAVPSAPSNVKIDFNNGVLGLAWNFIPSENITSFHVKRSTVSGSGYSTVASGLTTPITLLNSTLYAYDDTGLTNGTTYYYIITATNSSGESAACPEVSSTPQNVADGALYVSNTFNNAPLATNTLIAGAHYTAEQIWQNTNTSIWTEANLYRSSSLPQNDVTFGVARLLLGGSDSITNGQTGVFSRQITAPSTAGQYTWQWTIVQEFISNGIGSSSPAITVTVIPAVPTNVLATPGCGSIVLSWTAGIGATGYTVYRSETPRPASEILGFLDPLGSTGTTSYTDNAVSLGVRYFYYVASNTGSLISISTAAEGMNDGTFAHPITPTSVDVNGGCGVITLTWDAMDCATSYNVYRAEVRGGAYEKIASPTGAVYTDTPPVAGQTYFYRVTSVGAAGETPLLASAEYGAASTLPGQVIRLAATAGDGEVTLRWDASPGAASYDVYRDAARIASEIMEAGYTDTAVENGVSYSYTVRGVSACGVGIASAEASATPECCLGEWESEGNPSGTWAGGTALSTTAWQSGNCPNGTWTGETMSPGTTWTAGECG